MERERRSRHYVVRSVALKPNDTCRPRMLRRHFPIFVCKTVSPETKFNFDHFLAVLCLKRFRALQRGRWFFGHVSLPSQGSYDGSWLSVFVNYPIADPACREDSIMTSNDTGFQPPDLAFDFEVVGQDQCERPDATPLQCSPIAPCPVRGRRL